MNLIFEYLQIMKKVLLTILFLPFQILMPLKADINTTKYAETLHIPNLDGENVTSYLLCDDGRAAIKPKLDWHSAEWISSLEERKNNKDIKESIQSIKSYVFIPEWAKETTDFGFVNTISHLYKTPFWKKDWPLITTLYRSEDLPSTTKTYESLIYNSNNLIRNPYKGSVMNNIQGKYMDIIHKNQEGEELNFVFYFGDEDYYPGFFIKGTNGKQFILYSINQARYKNEYSHPDVPMTYIASSLYLCPEKTQNILVRAVYPLGLAEDGKSRYLGVNLIEYNLKTTVREDLLNR